MKKIFIIMSIILLSGLVNADCFTSWYNDINGQSSFNLNQWNVYAGSGTSIVQTTNGNGTFINMCKLTQYHGNMTIISDYTALPIYPDEFDITVNFSFSDDVEMRDNFYISLVNNTDTGIKNEPGYISFLYDRYSSSLFQRYCGGSTIGGTTLGSLDMNRKWVRFLKHSGESVVYMSTSSNNTLVGCDLGTKLSDFLSQPVLLKISFGYTTYLDGYFNCARIWVANSTSNMSIYGTYRVMDENGNGIEGCSVSESLSPAFGELPFSTPLTSVTDVNGYTTSKRFVPACYITPYYTDYLYDNVQETICTGYDPLFTDLIRRSSLLNEVKNITMVNISDTTSTQYIRVLYSNDTEVISANVSMVNLNISYKCFFMPNIFGFGVYRCLDIPYGLYDIYIGKLPYYAIQKYDSNIIPNMLNVLTYSLNEVNPTHTVNVLINVTNFGNINMLNNLVKIYECDYDNCEQAVRYGSCTDLYPSNTYTNPQGYRYFSNINIQKPYLCAYSHYFDISRDLPLTPYQSHIVNPSDTNIRFDYSYNQLVTNQTFNLTYPVCVCFYDTTQSIFVSNVSFYAIPTDNNRNRNTIQGKANNTGYYCWNNTYTGYNDLRYNFDYAVSGYKPYNKLIALSLSQDLCLDLEPITVSTNLKYTLSGYAMSNNVVIPNLKVESSCMPLPTRTNSLGLYNYTGIPINSECCLIVNDVGYSTDRPCITMKQNTTNFNITLTPKSTEKYDVEFYTYVSKSDVYGGQSTKQDLSGVTVKVSLDGYVDLSCTTNSRGLCVIYDLYYNKNYAIKSSKDDYRVIDLNQRMTESLYEIEMFNIATPVCIVDGYIKNNSIGVEANVNFYDANNNKILDAITNRYGYYTKIIPCNEKIKVESVLNNEYLSAFVTVTSIGESGGIIKQDFNYVSTIPNADISDAIWFLQYIVIPFTYVIVVLFMLVIFFSGLRKLFGGQ